MEVYQGNEYRVEIDFHTDPEGPLVYIIDRSEEMQGALWPLPQGTEHLKKAEAVDALAQEIIDFLVQQEVDGGEGLGEELMETVEE